MTGPFETKDCPVCDTIGVVPLDVEHGELIQRIRIGANTTKLCPACTGYQPTPEELTAEEELRRFYEGAS